MARKCTICKAEYTDKTAGCPYCGRTLYISSVGFGILQGQGTRTPLKTGELHVSEQRFMIKDNSDQAMYGALFGAIGAAVAAATNQKTACNAAYDEVAAAEYPLREKYGKALNTVKGNKGILLTFRAGGQMVLRASAKKLSVLADQLRLHGVPVD